MKPKFIKKKILMIFTQVPYPLRSTGLSMRYFPIIEYLSKNHTLDMVIFERQKDEPERATALQKFCRCITLFPDPKYSKNARFSKYFTYFKFLFPWTPPLSFIAHNGGRVTQNLIEVTRNKHFDCLIWVGSYLLPNLFHSLPYISVNKVVVDFIDSPTLLMRRNAERIIDSEPLDIYERWKIKNWEEKIVRKVDTSIYISRVDANSVPFKLTAGKNKYVIPNGVNIDSYSQERNVMIPSPNIGFLGNMSYPPNIEALLWLYHKVFVPLRKLNHNLSLVVIGRNPSSSILELKEKQGVFITGTVNDIWSYINSVDVFAFPLWTGAGLKNKVLEAMYSGRPVITTPVGNEGIDAISGRDLSICNSPEEFQEEILRLLNSPTEMNRMGSSAHNFVKEKFSWPQILKTYENLILGNTNLVGQEFLAGARV